jgi:hypothetical protein
MLRVASCILQQIVSVFQIVQGCDADYIMWTGLTIRNEIYVTIHINFHKLLLIITDQCFRTIFVVIVRCFNFGTTIRLASCSVGRTTISTVGLFVHSIYLAFSKTKKKLLLPQSLHNDKGQWPQFSSRSPSEFPSVLHRISELSLLPKCIR